MSEGLLISENDMIFVLEIKSFRFYRVKKKAIGHWNSLNIKVSQEGARGGRGARMNFFQVG